MIYRLHFAWQAKNSDLLTRHRKTNIVSRLQNNLRFSVMIYFCRKYFFRALNEREKKSLKRRIREHQVDYSRFFFARTITTA